MCCTCIGHDITVREVAIRNESKKRTAALQRWSTKWHRFVDTTGIEIADGDNVTIREHVCKAVVTGEQQSKDEVRLLCFWYLILKLAIEINHWDCEPNKIY